MNIQQQNFDYLFSVLAHGAVRKDYERKRLKNALLAMSCQNYFFSAPFTNASGAAGVTGVAQTLSVDRPILLRGGGLNSKSLSIITTPNPIDVNTGAVNIQIIRTGTGRAQMSLNALRSCAYLSDGQGQPWQLDWPAPIRLDPNESLQVRFTQLNATTAGTLYAVNFYGVAVDPSMQCDADITDSVCEQIRNSDQRTYYWNLKTPNSAGTLIYPAQGNPEITQALTDRAPAHLLVLGMRWNDNSYLPGVSTLRISSGDGHSFSREEIAIEGFEFYNSPDSGYFRFTVPHFIREGQALNAQITSNIDTNRRQFEGEVNLICVTV